MAVTLTITISTADTTRVVHALCTQAQLTETQANAKQAILNYIKQAVKSVENTEAIKTALATPTTDVNPT